MNTAKFTLKKLDNPSFLKSYSILIRFHGSKAQVTEILHETQRTEEDFDITDAILHSKSQSFQSKLVQLNFDRLAAIPDIAIGFNVDGHAFLVKVNGDAVIMQTADGAISKLSFNEFYKISNGYLFLTKSRASILGSMAKFDFSWFIPVIIRYRKELTQVLVMSFVVQLIALATPLFFQVITDKVLVHHANTTLNVIAIGLLLTILFDTTLSWIRSYVFSHTSSRIDVKLGSQLFGHLTRLPVSYFAVRRVGDSVARVRELENIRAFLTNNSITLILDTPLTTNSWCDVRAIPPSQTPAIIP